MAQAPDCGTQYVNSFDYSKLKDRSYKGEDYMVDSTLVKGPLQNRHCTDCFWLLIWFAFLGGMGWMTVEGYLLGDVNYMLAPIGSYNPPLVCGYGTVQDYPYLFVVDLQSAVTPITNFFNYGYCAQSCPKSSTDSVVIYDNGSITVTTTYDTTKVMKYCVPTASALAGIYSSSDGTY